MLVFFYIAAHVLGSLLYLALPFWTWFSLLQPHRPLGHSSNMPCLLPPLRYTRLSCRSFFSSLPFVSPPHSTQVCETSLCLCSLASSVLLSLPSCSPEPCYAPTPSYLQVCLFADCLYSFALGCQNSCNKEHRLGGLSKLFRKLEI